MGGRHLALSSVKTDAEKCRATGMSKEGLANGFFSQNTKQPAESSSPVFQNQEIEELTKICDELIAKLGKTD